jgi:hypothetical protein
VRLRTRLNHMLEPTLRLAYYILGVMHNLCLLIVSLGVVAAGCCSYPHSSSSDVDVPVVRSQAGRALVPPFAFSQLSAGRLSIVGQARHRVFSISDGLPDVRTVSKNPIVDATDQDGWFFFATSVASVVAGVFDTSPAADVTIHLPTQFISGYAIRHGSRQIVYWSTW